MTTAQIVAKFYEGEETPEPSELAALIDQHDAIACSREVKREIEKRHKHRGWTTGKRMWELRLLWFANTSLGLPAGKWPTSDQKF